MPLNSFGSKKIFIIVVVSFAGLILISVMAVFIFGSLGVSTTRLAAPAPMTNTGTAVSGLGGSSGYAIDKNDISAPTQSSSESQTIERKMIETGLLELLVNNADQTAKDMQGIAERLGGFVSASNVYEISEGIKTGSVTIRIPASSFSQAMDDTKKLAIKVEHESVTAQDVTEQYVDLESRLRNLQAQEQQYLIILKQAVKIADIMQVSSKIDEVRLQIEQIQGQLNYLSRQVDMASLSANLTEEADVQVFGLRWRPLYEVKLAFRNMLASLQGYIDSMIKVIFSLPVILLWLVTIGLIILICWKIIRWIWRRFLKPPAAV